MLQLYFFLTHWPSALFLYFLFLGALRKGLFVFMLQLYIFSNKSLCCKYVLYYFICKYTNLPLFFSFFSGLRFVRNPAAPLLACDMSHCSWGLVGIFFFPFFFLAGCARRFAYIYLQQLTCVCVCVCACVCVCVCVRILLQVVLVGLHTGAVIVVHGACA